MKVWEKCNEVKGCNATIDEIASWAYFNRYCPLMFDVGLEIDIPLNDEGYPVDNGFLKTAEMICDLNCGNECLMKYLNSEFIEVTL